MHLEGSGITRIKNTGYEEGGRLKQNIIPNKILMLLRFSLIELDWIVQAEAAEASLNVTRVSLCFVASPRLGW